MAFRPKAKKPAVKPAPSKLVKENIEPQQPVQEQPQVVPETQYYPPQPQQPQVEEEPMQVWTVTEVPTSTARVARSSKTGEYLDQLDLIVQILNILEELRSEE